MGLDKLSNLETISNYILYRLLKKYFNKKDKTFILTGSEPKCCEMELKGVFEF